MVHFHPMSDASLAIADQRNSVYESIMFHPLYPCISHIRTVDRVVIDIQYPYLNGIEHHIEIGGHHFVIVGPYHMPVLGRIGSDKNTVKHLQIMDYQCLLNSSILLGDPGTRGWHYQPYGLKGIGRPYSRSHRIHLARIVFKNKCRWSRILDFIPAIYIYIYGFIIY